MAEHVTKAEKMRPSDIAFPQHVSDPADWTGPELAARDDWTFVAERREASHFVDTARAIEARLGNDADRLLGMTSGDFDLGPFRDRLAAMVAQVKDGLGVASYRGLPLDELSLLQTAIVYWGIGLHIGSPISNNPEGDMIGHVLDTGKDYDDPNHRGYQTNVAMDYHCDQSDFVALLCLRPAKRGGRSKLASSIAVYNRLVRQRPDLVAVLMQPYCWTKHAEKNANEASYYESPVFNFNGDQLSTSFGPKHMIKGHALADAPDMTRVQAEAIDLMERLAEEMHTEMDLRRGDIQFVNNYTILHTREAFEDWPDPARKRVLWRLWLSVPGFRERTPFSNQWANGVATADTKERIRLIYES